jgi:protein SCO1
MIIAAVALAASLTQLEDQRGRHFTLASLRGEPAIVTFVAAHCTDACPLIDAQFSRTAREVAREKLPVRLVTITLDPEHDPPAVMRHLAATFGADPHYWLVASGTPADVHRVMHAFGVVAQRGKNGYADVHTTFIYLLNSRGELSGVLLASAGSEDYLIGEIHRYLSRLSQ